MGTGAIWVIVGIRFTDDETMAIVAVIVLTALPAV